MLFRYLFWSILSPPVTERNVIFKESHTHICMCFKKKKAREGADTFGRDFIFYFCSAFKKLINFIF